MRDNVGNCAGLSGILINFAESQPESGDYSGIGA